MMGGVFEGSPAISPAVADRLVAMHSSNATVVVLRITGHSILNPGRLRLIIAASFARVYKGM
jgi:hypothetical protein